MSEKDALDFVEEIENDELDIIASAEDMPVDSYEEEQDEVDISAPDWTAKCMAMLSEEEKHKDRPRVAGLRRIMYGIFGRPQQYAGEPMEFMGKMVVKFIIIDKHGNVCSGIADACTENTRPPYSNYLSAMAETRAEGRALVKYLNLSINVAEELSDAEEEMDTFTQSGPIKENQKIALKNICKRKDVNCKEFVSQMLKGEYNKVTDLSYGNALTLLENINGNVDLSEFVGYSEEFFEK